MTEQNSGVSRRKLFHMIGTAAGSAMMYQAMGELGYAAESGYAGPVKLSGDVKGATVLVLGGGVAGLTAALEMRDAGYKVQLLEYQNRPGGRSWSIRGGDTVTELGGFTQKCQFDSGFYINPGPMRIPHHHYALMDYCRRLNVALEPFNIVNYNAYIHNSKAFGGKPKRYREVQADFDGYVAELLAKCTAQNKLDESVTKEDREILLSALRQWGALDKDYKYKKSEHVSNRRGFASDPGGGLTGKPVDSEPDAMSDMLKGGMWNSIAGSHEFDYQAVMFQPVGGMDMIGKAFARELGDIIKYNCKVTDIKQDANGVTVTYVDTLKGGPAQTATAQWCVNTIPTTILSQLPMNISTKLRNAINALPYTPGFKAGLQFKRRFWEEDDKIYGGLSYTDLQTAIIGYPNTQYQTKGKGVLLGGYTFGPHAYELTSMAPEERIKRCLEVGRQIHPQYDQEFENGVSVGWHRIPWTMGCFGQWTEANRERHYANLCAIDGRMVLAGEQCSYLPAWQAGSITSALDAITRIHQRVMAA